MLTEIKDALAFELGMAEQSEVGWEEQFVQDATAAIATRLSEGVVWEKILTVLEGEFTKASILVDDKGYRYYPWWMGTELGVGECIEVTVKIVEGTE